MPPPQHAQGFQDKDAQASAGNAGGVARPSDVSVPAGGNGTNAAAAVYAKPLTEKEMLAADEAKDKLDRMVKVEALVGKRKRFFSYLKKTHEEGGFWLNCVQLTRQGDLAVYAAELSSQRILRLFYLGVGLAKLLQSKGGLELIRGILQLLEEWEYHFALAGVAHHSVKAMLAKNIDNIDHSARGRDASEEGGGKHQEQIVARLKKFNNEVVYENLLTPEVPFALDYLEVVFSLCEVMCRIYAKFVEEECYKNAFVYDGLVKVDNKIKHHIINVFAKDFTDMSTNIAKDELRTLR
ncbi:unnamed protein product [Ectocarpus sp. 4 AP-2014]